MAATPPRPANRGPRLTPRLFAALVSGKAAGWASRLSGHGGGTSVPGKVARRVEPGILGELLRRRRDPVVAITGSNGKTTTARLTAALLRGEGMGVLTNAAGANLIQGVTSLAVESADLRGRLPAGVLLIEVDEATLPRVQGEIGLGVLLVTDLFRDQLDRYGELYAVANAIDGVASGLASEAMLIVNADDPLVSTIGGEREGRRLTFGFDLGHSTDRITRAADTIRCPVCRSDLRYRAIYLSHLGDYACTNCDFHRPPLDVAVTEIEVVGLTETRMTLRLPGGELRLSVPQAGLHIGYNTAAAVAILVGLEMAMPHAVAALAGVGPAFGRLETIEAGDRQVVLAFAKNPTSFNTTLRTLAGEGEPRNLLLALSNTLVDGEDFAWLWDVDFEASVPAMQRVIVSGTRADELANRLKYAGLDPERIETVDSLPAALDRGLETAPRGARLTVVAGYTPTIEIREAMHQRGWVGRFWETEA